MPAPKFTIVKLIKKQLIKIVLDYAKLNMNMQIGAAFKLAYLTAVLLAKSAVAKAVPWFLRAK